MSNTPKIPSLNPLRPFSKQVDQTMVDLLNGDNPPPYFAFDPATDFDLVDEINKALDQMAQTFGSVVAGVSSVNADAPLTGGGAGQVRLGFDFTNQNFLNAITSRVNDAIDVVGGGRSYNPATGKITITVSANGSLTPTLARTARNQSGSVGGLTYGASTTARGDGLNPSAVRDVIVPKPAAATTGTYVIVAIATVYVASDGWHIVPKTTNPWLTELKYLPSPGFGQTYVFGGIVPAGAAANLEFWFEDGLAAHMNGVWSAVAIPITGIDNSTPIHLSTSAISPAGAAQIVAPTIAPTIAGTELMNIYTQFGGGDDTPGADITAPAGQTERGQRVDRRLSQVMIATESRPNAGATGTRTATSTKTEAGIGFSLSLKPAVALNATVTVSGLPNGYKLRNGATVSNTNTINVPTASVIEVLDGTNVVKQSAVMQPGDSWSFADANKPMPHRFSFNANGVANVIAETAFAFTRTKSAGVGTIAYAVMPLGNNSYVTVQTPFSVSEDDVLRVTCSGTDANGKAVTLA